MLLTMLLRPHALCAVPRRIDGARSLQAARPHWASCTSLAPSARSSPAPQCTPVHSSTPQYTPAHPSTPQSLCAPAPAALPGKQPNPPGGVDCQALWLGMKGIVAADPRGKSQPLPSSGPFPAFCLFPEGFLGFAQ